MRPAKHTTPIPARGTPERRASPWLVADNGSAPEFTVWREVEQRLRALAPAMPGGVAPATMLAAFSSWWTQLAASPAKQWELAEHAMRHAAQAVLAATGAQAITPLPQDKRFNDEPWKALPFHWIAQTFLLRQAWWHAATTGVPGVSPHHERMVSFAARQWLDTVSPSNFVSLNPVVQRRTLQEGGMNLLRGATYAIEDAWREATGQPPAGADVYEPGRNVAITPGRVVLRNRLIELIQYAPSTPTVHAEPVLVVPAWIMKYYVLDLSPHNSLIKHLVDQGHTVFAISWKNPDAGDRDLGMEDYAQLGVMAALSLIARIVPKRHVHAVGYCLGGTLLAAVAAALERDGATPLKTLTLMAAQTDFTEPGEIALFVDDAQVEFLEQQMRRSGYLDKSQMKASFQLLRSNDLVWSYRMHSELLGERRPVSDLMAWNADGTRLPCRMHTEYLRGLFLRNALARGEWCVGGRAVSLHDIKTPIFSVGTVQDHVAPWRSVYKLHQLIDDDTDHTFVLTAGGHNVGIVNPPGQAISSYRLRRHTTGMRLLTPDEWLAQTEPVAGSWWTAWTAWLARHSSRRRSRPPAMGAGRAGLVPTEAAPGTYVHQR